MILNQLDKALILTTYILKTHLKENIPSHSRFFKVLFLKILYTYFIWLPAQLIVVASILIINVNFITFCNFRWTLQNCRPVRNFNLQF